MLRHALQVALATLADNPIFRLDALAPLRRRLRQRLCGKRPLTLVCTRCEKRRAVAFTPRRGQGRIVLCRPLFALGQERVNAVVFHELIHVCGGYELDAEAFENHCFRRAGATRPTRRDFRLFRECRHAGGLRAGKFVLWAPDSGRVFVKDRIAGKVAPGAPLKVRFRRRPPRKRR